MGLDAKDLTIRISSASHKPGHVVITIIHSPSGFYVEGACTQHRMDNTKQDLLEKLSIKVDKWKKENE